MKKFLAIMLILSMVFSMSTGMAFAETTAEENQNTELVWTNCGDDVQYALDETSGTLTIQGNGSISSFPFENDTASLRKIRTVNIGSGVTGISAIAKNTSYKKNFIDYLNAYCDGNFTSIEVEEGNAVYCAQDGVLYSADMTTLLAYPANKPDTEFSIPETVERIGYYSYNQERFDCPFYYVHQIEKMYVPAKTNLYFGSYWVFGEKSAKYPYFEVSEDNEKYTSVDGILFTKDMKTICAYPYYKTDLSSYTIPDTVTTIENRAFNNCDFLTEIILPDGLRTIKYWGFAEAHGLKSLTIPSKVTSIGSNGRSWTFVNCRSLETLIFESGSLLSDIPDEMCSGVSSLKTVVLGDNILTIGDRAFYGCTGLSEINIPSSVYEIGANSFTNCPALRAVVHEDSYGLDYVQQKGITYVVEGNLDSVTLTMENTIISEIENQNYTGTAIKPDPSVIYTDSDSNTKVLKKGIDYTISYENNVNPGTAGITIKGKGNYNGTLAAYFEIVEASHEITQENAVVYAGGSALEGRKFTYSGQPVIPNDISLMVDGVKVEEQYYDVICTNNINTGTAKIQVIGKSGYAGSAESYYSIIARSIGSCAISNLAGKYSYTGGPITPNVTLSISSGYPDYVQTTLKEGRDYTVTYSNNVNITTATSKAAITFSAIEGGNFTGSMQATFDIVHGAGYG
ncbi:MAG: leucine-rich repeat domain-containing protein, partial [Anaerovoracaceae bacterium]